MSAERRRDWSVITQAALAPGDRWLCADSVAVLLGMFTPDGEPNRRAFLEGPAQARAAAWLAMKYGPVLA